MQRGVEVSGWRVLRFGIARAGWCGRMEAFGMLGLECLWKDETGGFCHVGVIGLDMAGWCRGMEGSQFPGLNAEGGCNKCGICA